MIFENERELVNAYLEKCKKTGWCDITEQDVPVKNRFVEFHLPGAGRVDLIDFSFNTNPQDGELYGNVNIIEFKNNNLCRDDIVQINRYYQWVKNAIFEKLDIDNFDHEDACLMVDLYLVGSQANFNLDTILLIKSIPNLQIVTHKIINGQLEINHEELPEIEYSTLHNETFLCKYLSAAKMEWDAINSNIRG